MTDRLKVLPHWPPFICSKSYLFLRECALGKTWFDLLSPLCDCCFCCWAQRSHATKRSWKRSRFIAVIEFWLQLLPFFSLHKLSRGSIHKKNWLQVSHFSVNAVSSPPWAVARDVTIQYLTLLCKETLGHWEIIGYFLKSISWMETSWTVHSHHTAQYKQKHKKRRKKRKKTNTRWRRHSDHFFFKWIQTA